MDLIEWGLLITAIGMVLAIIGAFIYEEFYLTSKR